MGNTRASMRGTSNKYGSHAFFYKPVNRHRGEPCSNEKYMKKIIIVKGAMNSGKTSTLDALIQKLLAKGYHLLFPTNVANITSFVICEKDEHRIGIITFGDPTSESDVEGCLEECLNYNCDTIFAASRTRGSVYNLLYHFATTNGYTTIETSPLFAFQFWTTGISISTLHQLFANMLSELI